MFMNTQNSASTKWMMSLLLVCVVTVLLAQPVRAQKKKSVEEPENDETNLVLEGTGPLEVRTENGEFSMKLGGRIMIDYSFTDVDDGLQQDVERAANDPDAADSGAEFRRARLFTSGSYRDVGYKFQLDFAGSATSIKDAYLDFPSPIPSGHSLKVGRFFEAWGFEGQISSKYLNHMEYAAPVSTFYSFRGNGIGTWGNLWDNRIHWGASLSRSLTDGRGFDRAEGNLAASARITGIPYQNEDGNRLWHIGLSGSTRSQDDVSFTATPELHNLEPFVNTGTIQTDRQDIGNLETALILDQFKIQGEYIRNRVEALGGQDDPTFGGYYITTAYWLTGESEPFSREKANFTRPDPNKPLFEEGGWGAWQVALRYSTLDLTDEGITGGEMDNVTVGLNWWMNSHTKIMLNYIRSDVSDGVRGGSGDSNLLGFRFQVDF